MQRLYFPTLNNVDWEEITQDSAGNIFIGDFGNNHNKRRDLCIFKVHPAHPDKVDTIRFHYADQTAFPPEKSKRNYDCEAFFWYKKRLYLFSKNRGSKWVHYYSVPDSSGNYTLLPSKSAVYLESMVTGASLRPDKKQFVLLAYGKVYFFNLTDENNPLCQP